MKCPYCDYFHGSMWNEETEVFDRIEGSSGGFYDHVHEMERDEGRGNISRKDIYGCPSCNKLFMD